MAWAVIHGSMEGFNYVTVVKGEPSKEELYKVSEAIQVGQDPTKMVLVEIQYLTDPNSWGRKAKYTIVRTPDMVVIKIPQTKNELMEGEWRVEQLEAVRKDEKLEGGWKGENSTVIAPQPPSAQMEWWKPVMALFFVLGVGVCVFVWYNNDRKDVPRRSPTGDGSLKNIGTEGTMRGGGDQHRPLSANFNTPLSLQKVAGNTSAPTGDGSLKNIETEGTMRGAGDQHRPLSANFNTPLSLQKVAGNTSDEERQKITNFIADVKKMIKDKSQNIEKLRNDYEAIKPLFTSCSADLIKFSEWVNNEQNDMNVNDKFKKFLNELLETLPKGPEHKP